VLFRSGSNSNIIRENISIDNNHDHKPKNSNQNSYRNEKQPIVPTAEKKDNLKKEVPSYNDSRFEEL
jgi:hypothetical protein